MNVLYEPFPETVLVNEEDCRIVTDFREWIKLLELVEDASVPAPVKARLLLEWYVDTPSDEEAAIDALGAFLKAEELNPHRSHTESKNWEQGQRQNREQPGFSYSQDAGCIFCAFMECYRIDLEQIPYMHWWKFRVLFEGLNEETEIKQRIRYRQMDLSTIKDKEERKRVKKIQRAIALKTDHSPVGDFDIGDVFS